MATKLSLVSRKNIKEYEEKMTEAKEAIHAIVEGAEITYDIDYASLAPFVEKGGYKDRVGEVAFWYIEGILSNFKRVFADETAKGSLQSAWTTGVIRIVVGTLKKNEYKYSDVAIDNGDLVITVYQIGNTSDCGANILDKLGDSSGLSVKAAQDWKQYDEKRNERFTNIHDMLQLSCDVTLDVDTIAFAAFADKEGYKDRVGEVVDWYLDGMESTFNRRYKDDETARTAIQSAWTTGVIRVTLGTLKKNEYKYMETNVDNGDLVITVFKLGNTSETGQDLLDKLGDASGLTVKSAQSWKEYEEKRTEHFQSLQEATGITCDVTLDIDLVLIEGVIKAIGYADRIGECVDWIIEGLARNFKRVCEEELTKEAIAEAWTTGVIRFEENKKINYHDVNFVDGNLVVFYNPKSFCSNVSDVGSNIESKL